MAIKSRNKLDPAFNSSSMSDLVFLLLIFFMLTSTLVAPNAIKLMLPSSTSKTMAKQTVTVYINEEEQYFVQKDKREMAVTDLTQLSSLIANELTDDETATVVLRADKNIAVQHIVNVIDAVNEINNTTGHNHKVILAPAPKK